MTEQTTNTLLLNILQQVGDLRSEVGGCVAQLSRGEEDRAVMLENQKQTAQQIDMIDRRTDITENGIIAIKEVLNPEKGPGLIERVSNLEAFNGKIGVIISVGSVVLWGVFYFIWNTLNWAWAHLGSFKDFFKGHQ